jgi:putative phosphoesterase
VLSALDDMGVEKILHAGDIIGYNPYPNETIELFRKNNIISILGNHDRVLITGDTSGFNPYAAIALIWTADVISSDNFGYIKGLRNVEFVSLGGSRITMFHGSPRDYDEYVYPENATPELLSNLNSDVLVLGHTHVQFKKEYPSGMIINPGSVGQPRDENPDAAFAILDTDSGEADLHRTSYDIEKVIDDIISTPLPQVLGLRLRLGL